MLDELRALAVFARVVEEGSIRGAARSLSLSPSVVSHHIRTLEERVGVTLLYRSTRKLVLTPAGERLVTEAQAMVASAERGLDEARGLSTETSGTLRVTMPAFLTETALGCDIGEFAMSNPRVRLTVSFSETPSDLLTDGFDLALRMGALDDSTHRTRRLAEMRRLLVAAPGLVSGRRPARAPKDLESWPFVHLRSREPRVVVRHDRRTETAQIAYEPRLVVDNAAALRAIVLAGVGVGTLPEVLVREDLARGRALELLAGWSVAPVAVHAVWPKATVKSALTSRFLDFIGPRVATIFAAPTKRARR